MTNFCLVDSDGRWVGGIRLPLNQVYAIDGDSCNLEFIAIARGKVPIDGVTKKISSMGGPRVNIPEGDCEGQVDDATYPFYEVYFGFCIEWRNGITYRRGLG